MNQEDIIAAMEKTDSRVRSKLIMDSKLNMSQKKTCIKILFSQKVLTFFLFISLIFLSIFAPLKSFVLQWLLDSSSKKDALLSLFFGIIVVALSHLFEYTSRDAFSKMSTSAIGDIRRFLADKLTNMSLYEYIQKGPETWFPGMTNDLQVINEDYYNKIFDFLFWGGIGTVAVIYMAVISPVLLAVSLFLSALPFIAPKVLAPYLSKKKNLLSQSTARYYSIVNESLHGYETTLLNNRKPFLKERLEAVSKENLDLNYNMRKVSNISSIITSLIAWIPGFLVLVIGVFLVFDGKITIGYLVTANSLINFIIAPFRNVANAYLSIKGTADIRKRVGSLMNYAVEETNTLASINDFESIDVEGLSFSYPNSENKILKDFSFHIQKGDKIAIVGSSGCGKSTFLKLLCKFYNFSDGAIQINGTDIRTIQSVSYYNRIAYIPQDPFIFEDTLKNNISLGKNYPEETILEILSFVGLGDYVHLLPDGLETVLSEQGQNISGGQKKRIAVARALIRECSVLVIDEATSSLDTKSTNSMVQWLLSLPCTVIMVTHDIFDSYMSQFTKIYYLAGGQILEIGTYDDLMDKKGELYKMKEAMGKSNTVPN